MSDEPAADLAVYLRVSTDEQREQETIKNQQGAAERYLTVHDIAPYGWYMDDGVSGTVPFAERPEGARLLADARAGHVRTALVWRLDRFGRNARAILNAVHDLEAVGVRLVSITESFDTSTPAGQLQLNMLASIAQFERDSILQRSNEGMERRLLSTTWMGGNPPFGLHVEGKKTTARLVLDDTPDPNTGYSATDVVRLAWHLLLELDWTCQRIAEHLDSLGIPTGARRQGLTEYTRHGRRTPLSDRWSTGVVQQMFSNPAYKGERPYCRRSDGQIILQSVPALVSVEQWDRAQAVLAAHRKGSHCNPRRTYLLRGLMRCAHCGAPYTTSWSHHSVRTDDGGTEDVMTRYYACSTHLFRQKAFRHAREGHRRDCTGVSVPAAWIETEVWADVEQFIRDPGATLLVLAACATEDATTAEEQRTALADVQRELDSQQAERDAVVALFRRGRISERDLDRQLDDIAREEAKITARQSKSMAALHTATTHQDQLHTARALLQQLHARLDDAETITPALQREVVDALVQEIRVETVAVGLSTRGRVKRQPKVAVTYCFDEPATVHATEPTQTPPEAAHILAEAASDWRP